jgi:hypothetical protein
MHSRAKHQVQASVTAAAAYCEVLHADWRPRSFWASVQPFVCVVSFSLSLLPRCRYEEVNVLISSAAHLALCERCEWIERSGLLTLSRSLLHTTESALWLCRESLLHAHGHAALLLSVAAAAAGHRHMLHACWVRSRLLSRVRAAEAARLLHAEPATHLTLLRREATLSTIPVAHLRRTATHLRTQRRRSCTQRKNTEPTVRQK